VPDHAPGAVEAGQPEREASPEAAQQSSTAIRSSLGLPIIRQASGSKPYMLRSIHAEIDVSARRVTWTAIVAREKSIACAVL
jgi:hypothetical protein